MGPGRCNREAGRRTLERLRVNVRFPPIADLFVAPKQNRPGVAPGRFVRFAPGRSDQYWMRRVAP